LLHQLIELFPKVQPDIQGHLIITAPPCMEFPPKGTYQLGETAFNRHMNIFVGRKKAKPSPIQLGLHRSESANDGPCLPSRQNAGPLQGLGVSNTALNVLRIKPTIKPHRARKCLNEAMGLGTKSSTPGLLG